VSNESSRRSLSVVIPAYNEERRLPRTVERISQFLSGPGYDAEIVVVDDGSRDRTSAILGELRAAHPLLRPIRHATNSGKGFAVRAGVLQASKEAVLICDADLSTPIEDVETFWPRYDRGVDILVGSRQVSGSQLIVKQPLHRQVMGRIFNGLVSLFCIRGFRDTQCGFKLFRGSAAQRVFAPLRTWGFAFDVEVLIRARRIGCRMEEVPVRWADAPGSRISPLWDSVKMAVDLIRIGAGV
jgi:dolichyl-phosphate beta-glucosyltransferase